MSLATPSTSGTKRKSNGESECTQKVTKLDTSVEKPDHSSVKNDNIQQDNTVNNDNHDETDNIGRHSPVESSNTDDDEKLKDKAKQNSNVISSDGGNSVEQNLNVKTIQNVDNDSLNDVNGTEESLYRINVDHKAFGITTETYRITVDSLQGEDINIETFFNEINVQIKKVFTLAIKTYTTYIDLGGHQDTYTIQAVFNLNGTFADNEYEEFDISDSSFISTADGDNNSYESIKNNIIIDFNKDDAREKRIKHLDIHIHWNIVDSSSYLSLPTSFKSLENRYVINVKNQDHASFKWAVLAALHPEIYRPNDYTLEEFSDEIEFGDIQHPVKLRDIPKIEKMNDMSFNVYVSKYYVHIKGEELEGPVYYSKQRKERHFNLLLLQDGGRRHYCYIKDLIGFIDENNGGIICDGCLNIFDESDELERHQKEDCLLVKTVLVGDVVQFNSDEQDKRMPIVVYADFEAYNKPIENISDPKTEPGEIYTENISKHVAYSFAYYIKCSGDDTLSHLETFYGQDCNKNFLKKLISDLERICTGEFSEVELIPVYFHNFTRYDGHFVISGITSEDGTTSVLGDKYSYIALHQNIKVNDKSVQLRFLDSMKFLPESLEKLANNLRSDQFHEIRKMCNNDADFDMFTKKGELPYDYITSLEVLQQTNLPEKELFYSKIKAEHITDEQYEHAQQIWNRFECTNLLEYSMIYQKTDVLLLADVFENLRSQCLATYELDPARYYSMSALSWDAMLKKTGVKLELLSDVTMLAFVKKAMRAGIAHCNRRHAVANNRHLPESYNPKLIDSYIMYYDANNLYGWAMSQPLPYGGFEWVSTDVDYNLPADSEIGYFLEVDLNYPEELHDWHADYPFCPEKKIIPTVKQERLVTDLTSKKKYVMHHAYLQICLDQGLVLEKIHRVLKFKQKPWLAPYINFNTQLRASASSVSEKNFYKLMNNSIYGKTIQNIEKYTDVKIFDHWFNKGYRRGCYNMVNRPDYHSHDIVSEDLIAVQLNKTKYQFKDPVYVGITVLDLSKCHMYDFHYNFMKRKFGGRIRMLYTDTDSFIYQIFTKDFYSDMKGSLEDRFDTSDYSADNQFGYPLVNGKKIGYFKDELNGVVVKQFVALRPKVYILEGANGQCHKRAAGAPKLVSSTFTVEDYKESLYSQKDVFRGFYKIQPVGHDLFTQKVRKRVLHPVMNTRHVMRNILVSLPFGHYQLDENYGP